MNVVEKSVSKWRGFADPHGDRAARLVPGWWHLTKRIIDVSGATAALIIAAPLLFVSMLAIVVVSPGWPLFAQERVGKNGRHFKMFKLRTMVDGAHLLHDDLKHLNEVNGPVFKIRNDPRLHAVGSVLRRTSLDEVPNLLNVLRGEMSLVGPRPPLPSEVEHYSDFALRRLAVKPGITCLWQISGRSNISFEEWMELDNLYIATWTPWNDLKILALTLPAVVRKEGAH